MGTPKTRTDKVVNAAIVLLALCTVVLTAGNVRSAFFPTSSMLTEPVDSVTNWSTYAAAGSRVGPAGARVTFVVFFDYQCPACRELLVKVRMLRRLYPQDLAVVWRNLPLRGHPEAMAAAKASVCASEAGRFEEMHNTLFLMQDSLGLIPWPALALRAGVRDTAAFDRCTQGAATQSAIDSDLAAARTLHALATPTLLINGREYIGDPQDLTRIVRYIRRKVT